MIYVTRLDGTELVLNCELIVTIEKTPDTLITLTNGERLLVRESVPEIVERTIGYRNRVYRGPGIVLSGGSEGPPGSGPPPGTGTGSGTGNTGES